MIEERRDELQGCLAANILEVLNGRGVGQTVPVDPVVAQWALGLEQQANLVGQTDDCEKRHTLAHGIGAGNEECFEAAELMVEGDRDLDESCICSGTHRVHSQRSPAVAHIEHRRRPP